MATIANKPGTGPVNRTRVAACRPPALAWAPIHPVALRGGAGATPFSPAAAAATAAAGRLPSAGRRHGCSRLVARAAEPDASGAPAGQISSDLIDSMRGKISDALEAQSVNIVDVYGDGRHVSIDVVAAAFEGQNAVARQRMVYKAIWMELQEAVHAVDAMTTKTPAEAGSP